MWEPYAKMDKPKPIVQLIQKVSQLESKLIRVNSDYEHIKTQNDKLLLDIKELKKQIKKFQECPTKKPMSSGENTSWWWS